MNATLASDVTFVNDEEYQVSSILEAQWGYDQTNIDYYQIVGRKGLYVKLQPIGRKNVKDRLFEGSTISTMTGTCEPDPDAKTGPPTRRKLFVSGDKIVGCKFRDGYGWMDAWSGKPSNWTGYA